MWDVTVRTVWASCASATAKDSGSTLDAAMKTRSSILIAGAIIALAAPAAGSARILPIKFPANAKVSKHKVVPVAIGLRVAELQQPGK